MNLLLWNFKHIHATIDGINIWPQRTITLFILRALTVSQIQTNYTYTVNKKYEALFSSTC